jgi:GWxTD domain-containing protein
MTARLLFACCSAVCFTLSAQPGPAVNKKLRKELQSAYANWLKQDVAHIITDEERAAFSRLQTDDEREQFIEQFWLRRDPTPDTLENEFKEEHYRRIAYANEHFASGLPGWMTDRGRTYIIHGPPDEIEPHPTGGGYERPIEEGGGSTEVYPFEKWRYRSIEGLGTDIIIEFVDRSMSGEYRMAFDPSEKDALQHLPNSYQPDNSQTAIQNYKQFDWLHQFFMVNRPPRVRFRDLEALVHSIVKYNVLPMKVRVDYLRMTDSTVLAPVTIQFDNNDLQFKVQNQIAQASVNLYMRITTLARRPVSVQEDVVTVDSPAAGRSALYQKAFFLAPGAYRLNVVAKDVNGGNTNSLELALRVPQFEAGKLSASGIILADLIERVPARTVGSGQFVLGASKVRPRLSASFRRDESMGIYFQVYEAGAGETTQKPNGALEYVVIKNGSNQPVLDFSEEMSSLPDASAHQITVEKLLPLASLEPGDYTLKIAITDRNRNQVLTPATAFSVR